jgi:hypothetical protein
VNLVGAFAALLAAASCAIRDRLFG